MSCVEALLLRALRARLVILDLVLRGPRYYVERPRAVALCVASVAIAWLIDELRPRLAARVALALTIGVAVTAQLAFYRYFHAPLDDQSAIAARFAWIDVRPIVLHAAPALALTMALVAALELARMTRALGLPRRELSRRELLLAAGGLVATLLLAGSWRQGPTELRSAQALVALVSAPSRRSATEGDHPPLPPMGSRRAEIPSILFVITESVRAASFCGAVDPSSPCEASPELAALLPDRLPLLEMRSVASYTALSMSVLLSGEPQVGSAESIQRAPDLFDYVRATTVDGRRATVHYWSAHKSNFFVRADPRGAVDSFLDAEELLGHPIEDVEEAVGAGLDRRLADECARRVAKIAPPYVAVVHLSGTHAPYFFDEATAPYRPFARVVTWSGLPDLERSYKNAIREQDASVARCVRAFLEAQGDRPHLVVYTSDHGESFGERSAIHHGQNLYDEQTHVPAFVYAGGGALGAAERANLSKAGTAFVTHLDVLPTILDALGILDSVTLGFSRPPLPGRSLLRPLPLEPTAVPITNCSAMWPCPLNTWGVLQGHTKLTAQGWDGAWRCLDLRGGEKEVPLADCAGLVETSKRFFSRRPNGDPNE